MIYIDAILDKHSDIYLLCKKIYLYKVDLNDCTNMFKPTTLQQTDSKTLNVNMIMSVTQIRKCASTAYHCYLKCFVRKHSCHEETRL